MTHQARPGTSASPPQPPPPSVRSMRAVSRNPVPNLWAARNRLTEEALANESPELTDNSDSETSEDEELANESTDNSENSEDEITEVLESEMGLTEQEILMHIQQVTYQSCPNETNTQNQTCTICQEDYVDGEKIGRLDCMHIFHLDCIKQWLKLKNVCPICKKTALEIDEDEDA